METTPFELTPKQKGLLEALSRETGKTVQTLLDEALDALREQKRPVNGSPNGGGEDESKPPTSVLDIFRPSWEAMPDEELDGLPTDLAAQVDHYVYGLPKRPA